MARTDVLQGTLSMLVLKTLAQGELHGYGITNRIHTLSRDLLRVEEGSLYPALHRMEQEGWIKSTWGTTETNRRARFYSITTAGKKQLTEEEKSWERLTSGIALVFKEAR